MTREEEIVRSTIAALAGTVTQVRPLRLPAAAAEPAGSAPEGPASGRVRTARRVPPGTLARPDGGPRRRPGRRWRAWAAPAAAAALVIALAVALVISRQVSNGGRVTPSGPAHSAGPVISPRPALSASPPARSGPVPRYFAELTPDGGGPAPRQGLLVGDTFTGQTLATATPPAGASFLSVSAAADDRTFAVFTAPAGAGPKAAGWWYLLRLAPGTSSPARLTRIPVRPLSGVVATAISGSGREIAVGRAYERGTPWLGVYSVATGRLLRSWSAHGARSFRIGGLDGFLPPTDSNPQSAALTWIHNDQAIAFLSVAGDRSTLRRVDLAAGGADIVKDSQVIWSSPRERCTSAAALLGADGKAVTCLSDTLNTVGKAARTVRWTVRWQAYPVAPPAAPHVLFEANDTGPAATGFNANTLWISASGDVMLVEWTLSGTAGKVIEQHFGIVSHGTFTPLKAPLDGNLESFSPNIAW